LLKALEEIDPVKARSLAEAVIRSLTEYERDVSVFNEARRGLLTSLVQSTPS